MREAKLMDETESVSKNNQAVEIVPDQTDEELITVDGEEVHDDPEETKIRQTVKQAAPVSDHSELTTSLAVLKDYKSAGATQLVTALESLADLGHEIDFGAVIVRPEYLRNLISILEDKQRSPAARETAVRTIGASLRNNPDAIKEVLGHKVTESLLKTLNELNTPDLAKNPALNKLSGRLVYALGSLVSTGEGDAAIYGESDHEYITSNGGDILRKNFKFAGPDVQRKTATFVADRALSSVWPIGELRKWSTFFQNELLTDAFDDSTKSTVLETLIKMHEFAPDPSNEQQVLKKRDHTVPDEELSVDDSFLNWLAGQASSASDTELRAEVKRARHQVFGNPLASRKNFEDL